MTRDTSILFALIMSIIFVYYGYAFFVGGYLRVNEVEIRPGEIYTGGTIIGCMSMILIASFQLGGISNNAKVMVEARVAGRMAYEVIDHIPEVDSTKKGDPVIKEELNG